MTARTFTGIMEMEPFPIRVFEARLGRLRSYLGWGALFFDHDNDGWSDILMVNGHLSPEIDTAGSDSHFRQPKLLFHNLGNGHFADVYAEAGTALSALQSSPGAAMADLLSDGRLSVAVNELHKRPSLLMVQQKPPEHWVALKAVGCEI